MATAIFPQGQEFNHVQIEINNSLTMYWKRY